MVPQHSCSIFFSNPLIADLKVKPPASGCEEMALLADTSTQTVLRIKRFNVAKTTKN